MSATQTGPGRPRKYATDEEAAEARRKKNRKYQKRYLKKRKERYENDPEYRRKCIRRSRRTYRSGKNFKPKGFGKNAGKAAQFAVPMKMNVGKTTRTKNVLPIDAMAEFIGIVPKVLSGWIEANKFPRPTHKTVEGQRVFTIQEANALAAVLKNGLADRAAFRATDKVVIVTLHETMEQLN